MVRSIVFGLALIFIGGMAALTIDDFISNGVTAAGIVAICVLVVLGVGIVGALLHPRRQ